MTQALKLGQSAAGRHVSALDPLPLNELETWSSSVGTVRFRRPVTAATEPRFRTGRVVIAGVGFGLAAAVLIGLCM